MSHEIASALGPVSDFNAGFLAGAIWGAANMLFFEIVLPWLRD